MRADTAFSACLPSNPPSPMATDGVKSRLLTVLIGVADVLVWAWPPGGKPRYRGNPEGPCGQFNPPGRRARAKRVGSRAYPRFDPDAALDVRRCRAARSAGPPHRPVLPLRQTLAQCRRHGA